MAFDTFIFVPAYNAEKTLGKVLREIPLSVWNRSKVLVIDDGSRVRAFTKIEELLKENPALAVDCFRFEKNRGYGSVVKKGIEEGLKSGADFIVCLHGDGQYPAAMLPQFIEHLEKSRDPSGRALSLLQGSRRSTPGGAKAGRMPLYKRLGGTFLTAVENMAFRQKLTDRHSGFILYRSQFLRTVNLDKLSKSFDIDLELISIADARGLALGELPIPTVYDGETSSLNVVSYGLRCLRQVFRRLWKASAL